MGAFMKPGKEPEYSAEPLPLPPMRIVRRNVGWFEEHLNI
jgi:hypothetical protein